jgi:hypothetical protein
MVRIMAMTLLLSGCASWSDTETSPREWDCYALCEGCEKCIFDCNMKGQGEDRRALEVDDGSS